MNVLWGWSKPVAIAGLPIVTTLGVFSLPSVVATTEIYTQASALAAGGGPSRAAHIVYDVFGSDGAIVTISYLDPEARTPSVEAVRLPWTAAITTNTPAQTTLLVQGHHSSIGCRITVDGQIKEEQTADGVNAATVCLVRSP